MQSMQSFWHCCHRQSLFVTAWIEIRKEQGEMFTHDQEIALAQIRAGKNIFLSGEAGTGKSYVVNEVKRLAMEHEENLLIMAPTGMAAVNVGGTTMHRALKLPVRLITPDDYKRKKKAPKVLRHADKVIVDEISMCRKDQFNYFGYMVELANKWRAKKHKAPIQLLLVGDFHQLPPVVTENDRQMYAAAYGDDIGDGYAFTSPYWEKLGLQTVILQENVRQGGQDEMQEALTKIRHGDASGIAYFNSHATRTSPTNDSIVVSALKRKVEQINAEKLNGLPGALYQSRAAETSTGTPLSRDQIPADDMLLLKPGARVMTTINDPENAGRDWQNGSLGTVTAIEQANTGMRNVTKVMVRMDRDHMEYEIMPYEWEIKDFRYNDDTKKIEEVVLGTFKQFPLRLAYAITIHKSQGATFDNMVLDPYCFAKGQLYVALSRCREIDGLHLTRPIRERDLMHSEEVEAFYAPAPSEGTRELDDLLDRQGNER